MPEPSISVPLAPAIQSPNVTSDPSTQDEISRIIYATALKPPKDPKEPEPTSDKLLEIPPLDILDLPDILTKRLRRGDPRPPLLYYGYPSSSNYLDLAHELGHSVLEASTFTKDELTVVYVKTNRHWIVAEEALPGFIKLFGHGERPKWYLSNQQPCWKWPWFWRYLAEPETNIEEKDIEGKDGEEVAYNS